MPIIGQSTSIIAFEAVGCYLSFNAFSLLTKLVLVDINYLLI